LPISSIVPMSPDDRRTNDQPYVFTDAAHTAPAHRYRHPS
jgi:hypothetical protein